MRVKQSDNTGGKMVTFTGLRHLPGQCFGKRKGPHRIVHGSNSTYVPALASERQGRDSLIFYSSGHHLIEDAQVSSEKSFLPTTQHQPGLAAWLDKLPPSSVMLLNYLPEQKPLSEELVCFWLADD